MSGQTNINEINSKLSNDEEEIVDSILSELNDSDQIPQKLTKQQMAQQQMAQQQMAQQQMAQQQMAQQKMNMIQKDSNDIMDNIKLEAKNIMTVVFLCVLLNIEQVDTIFKSVSMFTSEAGGLNMQAVFIKALMIGIIFYLVKTYLL